MMRFHCDVSTTRTAIDLCIKIIDNMLSHTNDSKYWRVNTSSEVRFIIFYFVFLKELNNSLISSIGIWRKNMAISSRKDVDEITWF